MQKDMQKLNKKRFIINKTIGGVMFMKKIVSAILIFTVLFMHSLVPSAAEILEVAGPRTYDIKLENPISVEKASAASNLLKVNAGGEATYGVTVPFDASSVDIIFSTSQKVTLDFYVDESLHKTQISPEEQSVNILFKGNGALYGDHEFKIKADKEISISKITLNRVPLDLNSKVLMGERELPNISDEERTLETAVLLGVDSNVLVVNNARRYIDYDDYKITPYVKDGTTYLPIHTLARALGYYYEDMPEKGYFFLRSTYGDVEFSREDGVLYKNNLEDGCKIVDDVALYRNGATWLPVRYFAEAIGEWVEYKDGIIIIDHKYIAKEIAANDAIMFNLKEEFKKYRYCTNCGFEFHVAQTANASDENDGSATHPFRTLAKASEMAQAGDTVIVHEGVYRETLEPKNNGTAKTPIVFKAAEGERVVLSANDELNNIVTYEDDIITAPVTKDLGKGKNQIFYKGDSIVEARHPNAHTSSTLPNSVHRTTMELSPHHFTMGNIQVVPDAKENVLHAKSAKAYSDTDLDQPDDFWVGGILVSSHGPAWGLCTAEITDSTKGELTLGNNFTEWFYYGNRHLSERDCAYITCTKNAIDMPGEWSIEDDRLYMKLPEGETAQSLKLEIKARQLVANLENSEYIQLHGFETIGGSIKMNNSKMCVLNNMDMKYLNHHTFTMDHRDGYIYGGDFSKQDAPQMGEVGIYIGGSDNAVVNSNFKYAAAAALYLSGTYTYIENNLIDECGYMGSYVNGIFGHAEPWKGDITEPRGGYTILQNTIRKTGRGSITFMSAFDVERETRETPFIPNEIAYNDLYDAMICTEDGGMVYTYMLSLGNSKIMSKYHHNMLWNSMGDNVNYANVIYNDNGTELVEVFDNVYFFTDESYHNQNSKTVFIQTDAEIYTNNNPTLYYRPNGKDGIEASEYPRGKVFISGKWDMQDNKKSNYGYLSNYEEPENRYYAKDATVSSGVVIKDGRAEFTGSGQWICFDEVNIPANAKIQINYSSSYSQDGDTIELLVGDSLETGKVVSGGKVSTLMSPKLSVPELADHRIMHIIGNHSGGPKKVWLRVKDYERLTVESIDIIEQPLPENFAAKVYGGYFTEAISGKESDPVDIALETPNTETDDYVVNRLWEGTTIRYDDVLFEDDAVALEYSMASMKQYLGAFQIRIDSLDSEPVATVFMQGKSWNEYRKTIVPLNRVIAAGEHDIYFTSVNTSLLSVDEFDGTGNLYYLGFLKSLENTVSTDNLTTMVPGGSYSKIEAGTAQKDGSTEMPALINIKPGAVISYDVETVDQISDFVYSASAETSGVGLTMSVYVDGIEGYPIARTVLNGDSLDEYNTLKMPTSYNVEAGAHKIYIVFSGNGEQKANLLWYSFGK